jgi:hypothetical protein
MVTTNHVAGETYTLMRIRLGANVAHQFPRRVRDSTMTRRVFVSEAWEDATEDLLARYEGPAYAPGILNSSARARMARSI